jgi:protocatechuate 3,4-dioxygenase alpha subunit
MDRVPTPSQTIGPFFHFGLTARGAVGRLAGPACRGERIRLSCRVLDGDDVPVDDALIEIWQADARGRYNHPDDTRGESADPAFLGFGRLPTGADGACVFETVKPGAVPGRDGGTQAPHINVSFFARGLLDRLVTRIYFEGDPANAHDPVLALVPEDRRHTLMARLDPESAGHWNFEIRLCSDRETVFFEI